MIKTKDLIKTVSTSEGELQILQPVNFSVEAGESIAIIGASGSGKSTLLGLLAGLDTATSGEIWLDGAPLHDLDEEARAQLRGEKVGFIFQSFMLVPSLTALENIMLPAEIIGLDNPKARALAVLKQVGVAHRAGHYPNQLSGGEQQRVAVARAFACKPTILFADEPTGNLDTATGEIINDLLFDLNREEGTTLVLVTHEMNLAARCHRTMQLQAGRQVDSVAAAEKQVV